VVVAALAAAGLAVGAPLGDGSSKDPAGDVSAKGLSRAEAAAVDLVRVHVSGANDVGVFVTATFRGNIEKELGRGHLKNAGAALIFRPKPGQGSTAGLVTTGAGKLGKLQRHTKSATVGAFRRGKTLTFFVLGPGWTKIRSAAVETVLDARLGKKAFAAEDTTPYMGPRLWDRFVTLHPIDLHVQVADPGGLSCGELKDLLDSIDADLDDPFFAQNVSFAVVRALHTFRSKVKKLLANCGGPPPPTTTGAGFAWSRFAAKEVAGSGKFTGPQRTFTSVRVVVPDQFTITNHLCPTQLPNAVISGNTITCGGGSLPTGQLFNLNLETSPPPPVNMGGQLFGNTGDQGFGPFTITGP